MEAQSVVHDWLFLPDLCRRLPLYMMSYIGRWAAAGKEEVALAGTLATAAGSAGPPFAVAAPAEIGSNLPPRRRARSF